MISYFFTLLMAVTTVPAVQNSNFAVGNQWRWNYFDPQEKLYSTEQYTVVANNGGWITLEMASHFPGETVFKAHHRIQVRLDDCLRSYANPIDKKPWSMRMFYLEDGQWKPTEPPSTLAFEEKFNCDPHVHDSSAFLTVFGDTAAGPAFMQKRWRRLEGSWYMLDGANAGVTAAKEFPHGAGTDSGDTYHMRFMDSTTAPGSGHFASLLVHVLKPEREFARQSE